MKNKITDGHLALLDGQLVKVLAVLDGKATYRQMGKDGKPVGLYRNISPAKLQAFDMGEQIARQFSVRLLCYLGADKLAEVNRRNSSRQPGVCHSHDFCDANVFMARAYRAATGKQMRCNNNDDCIVWGNAWDIAIAANFYVA